MPDKDHGSASSYARGCRCDPCKAAQSEYARNRIQRLREETPFEDIPHGTMNAYTVYKCRCGSCKHLGAQAARAYREKKGLGDLPGPIPHGTTGGYVNHKCRCDSCKKAHSDYRWVYNLRSRYGLTPLEYREILHRQDNRCAICRDSFALVPPNVDHDHETGSVRGLLCTRCNSGLGRAEDDVVTLGRAIKYLLGEVMSDNG